MEIYSGPLNAAIHAWALEVPTPHTIMTQVPPNSEFFVVVNLAAMAYGKVLTN